MIESGSIFIEVLLAAVVSEAYPGAEMIVCVISEIKRGLIIQGLAIAPPDIGLSCTSLFAEVIMKRNYSEDKDALIVEEIQSFFQVKAAIVCYGGPNHGFELRGIEQSSPIFGGL